jgi:type IV pilus assembly protein PilO
MPLKNRNTVILGVCLVVVGLMLYAYYTLAYTPLSRSMDADRTKIADLQKKLAVAQARAGQLSAIQAEMAGLQLDVAELEKQLPKDRELPALLRVFTHRLEAYGLTLTTFTPGKPVPKGLYDEISYQVALIASFHSLGHFLTAMGKGDRLFASRNLALNATSNKIDPDKTITATFQLIAFKYHE